MTDTEYYEKQMRDNAVPQTVRFEMRIRFDHIERGDKPREETFAFHELCKMGDRWYIERHRRKRGDRATSATYRMHLTAHGRAVCDNDEDVAARHADAINGVWFSWYPHN